MPAIYYQKFAFKIPLFILFKFDFWLVYCQTDFWLASNSVKVVCNGNSCAFNLIFQFFIIHFPGSHYSGRKTLKSDVWYTFYLSNFPI